MSTVISFNLQASVRKGCIENFRTLMHEMVASTQSEAGTQSYEWFLNEDGTACHIYERYNDSNAVMAHMGNFAKFAERFLSCVEPTAFCVYGNPNAEVRSALNGFNAVYLNTFGGFSR